MTTVYLALGSNVGDSKSHIEKAVILLSEKVSNIERAPIYTSKAVGFTDQADFLNSAIKGETELEPQALLEFIKSVEQEIGRVERFRWGPREIDIDIILYGDKILESSDLIIPHSQFRLRDFVLKPLIDIDSDVVDPVTKCTAKELLGKIPTSGRSVLRELN